MDATKDREKTSRAWAEIQTDRNLWNHPFTERYIERRVGATGGRNWVQHMHAEMLGGATFRRALALGCGAGGADHSLNNQFGFESLVGIDISEGAIAAAQKATDEAGLPFKYVVSDLNEPLPPEAEGPFDMVYAMASIHHIERLEPLFAQISERLTPDGRFWFLEYCGPSRFQWRQRVLELSNRILDVLPPELKGPFERVARPSPDVFANYDPSESVRSAEIMDLVHLYFDEVAVRDLGFTLAQPLLNEILRNFDDANPLHTSIYRLVYLLEETLMDHGVIEADTKLAVFKRR
ncbi:class I SAM-dependent methyltransferase [Bradyrhizobium sp. SZCCHNRI3037]|uniref:class I SAM-dependent methyltransferase n=1 Tax=Bradyrhizobium sp. SZCCHNRI3037 TaxID=3057290 RepID=UPI0029170930|nr:class I SAM-dependent methyltransferase [Bradyrhizobium sp. SZCCHNRI3037]